MEVEGFTERRWDASTRYLMITVRATSLNFIEMGSIIFQMLEDQRISVRTLIPIQTTTTFYDNVHIPEMIGRASFVMRGKEIRPMETRSIWIPIPKDGKA